ncbi:DUF805 domain-containing protein [Bombella sp. ESL0385]|uniref:DUF805 domain-containing protein n=1 Tax=Bombella sp. ESL0385 TaxID=2676446 RepID=UPI0012D9ABF0|nr:DUF805 domain-containing protein [Bombella sp. ESL0385]MUG89366.1 DUF805 domain-containing protein [Bombella sp. ESL0385]
MTVQSLFSLFKSSLNHYCNHPFNIRKRTTRAEYWPCFIMEFTLLCSLFSLLIFLFYLYSSSNNGLYLILGIILYFILLISGAVITIPTITALIRRLHDTGRSGWWLCISFTIIGYIPLIIFLCQKSQPTANRYGPVPKQRK